MDRFQDGNGRLTVFPIPPIPWAPTVDLLADETASMLLPPPPPPCVPSLTAISSDLSRCTSGAAWKLALMEGTSAGR